MTISLKCSGCGKGYKVRNEAAGKRFKCKECGNPIQVPGKNTKTCPFCAETVEETSIKCPYCKADLAEQRAVGSAMPQRLQRTKPFNSRKKKIFWVLGACGLLGFVVIFASTYMMYQNTLRGRMSQNNLKQIGLSLHSYHDVNSTLPPGAVVDADGKMHHGWQTSLLPYTDQSPIYNSINFKVPWDDPSNSPQFQNEIQVYLIPGIGATQDRAGFGLSHYSGNVNLFDRNSSMDFRSITDGMSNTIMAGEIAEGFQPWGKPGNWRDPSIGINTGPKSFGGPFGGAHFLFADGRVRLLSDGVDPKILKALSTPNGREDIGEF